MKKTKLGLIPEDWEIIELRDKGEVITGLTYRPEDVRGDGLLVLRSSNVQNGVLSYDNVVYVNQSNCVFNPVEMGDILICVRNGSRDLIGKNAMISKNSVGLAFGAFMAVYRSKLNNYIFHLFKTDYYADEIQKNLSATINSINGSDLKRFKFPFPKNELEQKKIARVLSAMDEEVSLLHKYLDSLRFEKKRPHATVT